MDDDDDDDDGFIFTNKQKQSVFDRPLDVNEAIRAEDFMANDFSHHTGTHKTNYVEFLRCSAYRLTCLYDQFTLNCCGLK